MPRGEAPLLPNSLHAGPAEKSHCCWPCDLAIGLQDGRQVRESMRSSNSGLLRSPRPLGGGLLWGGVVISCLAPHLLLLRSAPHAHPACRRCACYTSFLSTYYVPSTRNMKQAQSLPALVGLPVQKHSSHSATPGGPVRECAPWDSGLRIR